VYLGKYIQNLAKLLSHTRIKIILRVNNTLWINDTVLIYINEKKLIAAHESDRLEGYSMLTLKREAERSSETFVTNPEYCSP
jgi:hypothetical protein